MSVIYECVVMTETGPVTLNPENLQDFIDEHGLEVIGASESDNHEIYGQPIISGMVGPGWAGWCRETGDPIITYQQTAVIPALSA